MIHFPCQWKSLSILVLLLAFVSSNARADTRWFSVIASDNTVFAAVSKIQSLGGKDEALELVSSSDCKNLRQGIFLIAAGIRQDKGEAKNDVTRWRAKGIKDAYLRACKVIPDSRLALGVPVLDKSIYQRPPDTVNWTYKDAISRTKPISNSLIAIIQPRYEPIAEDVREGLRVSVSIIMKPGKESITLEADCIDPEVVASVNVMAVSCVNATAADQLLHVTRIYKIPSGKLVLEREQCRNPRLIVNKLNCQEEQLDKQGNLRLISKDYLLSPN